MPCQFYLLPYLCVIIIGALLPCPRYPALYCLPTFWLCLQFLTCCCCWFWCITLCKLFHLPPQFLCLIRQMTILGVLLPFPVGVGDTFCVYIFKIATCGDGY